MGKPSAHCTRLIIRLQCFARSTSAWSIEYLYDRQAFLRLDTQAPKGIASSGIQSCCSSIQSISSKLYLLLCQKSDLIALRITLSGRQEVNSISVIRPQRLLKWCNASILKLIYFSIKSLSAITTTSKCSSTLAHLYTMIVFYKTKS